MSLRGNLSRVSSFFPSGRQLLSYTSCRIQSTEHFSQSFCSVLSLRHTLHACDLADDSLNSPAVLLVFFMSSQLRTKRVELWTLFIVVECFRLSCVWGSQDPILSRQPMCSLLTFIKISIVFFLPFLPLLLLWQRRNSSVCYLSWEELVTLLILVH